MNKDERNEKLAQIARRIEEHGITVRGKTIFDALREAWNLGHKAGYDEGYTTGLKEECIGHYQKGQNDAWEIAKRIAVGVDDGGLSFLQLEEVFGMRDAYEVFMKYSLQECKSRIAMFDAKRSAEHDVKVGDFVKPYPDDRKIALVVEELSNERVRVLFMTGEYGIVADRYCTKVGCLQDMEGKHEDR